MELLFTGVRAEVDSVGKPSHVAYMACEKAFSIVDQIVFLNCFCSY